MIDSTKLILLINGSASLTKEEKQEFIAKLSQLSEKEKRELYQAFTIEKVLSLNMPQIKKGLTAAMDDMFLKTEQVYKKFERGLIQENEDAQEKEEFDEAETILNAL